VSERDGARAEVKLFLISFALVSNLVLIDAVTKELAIGYLRGSGPVTVIAGLFNLAYVENRGCAWGMFQGQVWPLAIFGVLALAFLIWKRKSVFGVGKINFIGEILLYSGIIGNLIDRVVRGYVVDMLDFHWGAHHFPCFNLADSFITVAAVLLIFTQSKSKAEK
jgi:signal peptidase II